MERVMIVGQPGSGKSTLARLLGTKTGLPVRHIDQIHWTPGWIERDKEEKLVLLAEIEGSERWILEGGLSATKPNRLRRCDTLIVLDMPFWLRAWRVAKRTVLHHGQTRPDLPENCPERFSGEFWHWIWTTRKTGRLGNLALIENAGPDVTVHHFRAPGQVRRFLAGL